MFPMLWKNSVYLCYGCVLNTLNTKRVGINAGIPVCSPDKTISCHNILPWFLQLTISKKNGSRH